MEVWSPGKRAVFWMAGKASSSTDTAQGPCEPGLVFQDWGKLPRGSLLVGGLPGACPAQHPDYKPASYGSENAISCGLPPSSCIRKRGHLYGRKNRGIFAVVGMGLRGLRVCSHIGHLLTPLPHASKPDGGRGPLIAGCGSPAGFKGWRGRSPGQRGLLDPNEPRESSPALASVAPVASTGSFHGALCCSPGPRFSPGESLLHTPRNGGRGCVVGAGGGDSTSGGPRS